VTILRYVAARMSGGTIHPSYVEGQMQGGVVQGIGWVLNEEYIYDKNTRLDNPGFLDYRVPVAPDIPMIDAVLVEVPNPAHPQRRPRASARSTSCRRWRRSPTRSTAPSTAV
jgi:CO/xanthine dehydrogenase Mo-binding subunit